MVLKINKKILAVIFLLYSNIMSVFGYEIDNMETGLVQYGENIDRSRLELLEDKQLIHLLGNDKDIVIGTYTIRNRGDEYKTTLGILFQVWQSGFPHPEELNLQFFVNNKKVDYYKIENFASVNFGEKRREDLVQSSTCWALIDVTFPKNSIVTVKTQHTNRKYNEVYSSYNSPYMEYFPDMLYWNGPTKFSIEIINEYIRENNVEEKWLSDIGFTSKNKDRQGITIHLNTREYLQTLKDMEKSIIKVRRKNGNTFLIEFNDEFYKNYHRSFIPYFLWWEGYLRHDNEEIFLDRPMFQGPRESDYISKRLLGPYELIFLTEKQLRVMRNVFYARHGYIFKSEDMQAMFKNKFYFLKTQISKKACLRT